MARRANGVRAGSPVGAGTDPVLGMSADERLAEVARILALGILRLRARRSHKNSRDPNHLREFGLDFAPQQSVCGPETDGNGESA